MILTQSRTMKIRTNWIIITVYSMPTNQLTLKMEISVARGKELPATKLQSEIRTYFSKLRDYLSAMTIYR